MSDLKPGGKSTALLADRLALIDLTMSDVPALLAAYELSESMIARARELFLARADETGKSVDVVAFGSLARREFTSESDLDYLVVTYALDSRPGAARHLLEYADSLRTRLVDGVELRAPGATGVFGRVISAADMVERIGLEEDTNHSHTRRILLLEESVSLYEPERHAELLAGIVSRYLYERAPGRDNVPRFLLNDIVRYWRTIAVDYQAKSFGRGIYSLRYLKLLISRKLTFAAAVAPLVECAQLEHGEVGNHLVNAFQEPTIPRFLRLAENLTSARGREAIRECVLLADRFTAKLGSAEWRAVISEECSQGDPTSAPHFGEMRQWGKDLQERLEEVFFDPALRFFTARYMIF